MPFVTEPNLVSESALSFPAIDTAQELTKIINKKKELRAGRVLSNGASQKALSPPATFSKRP
jgi:hypothetical protein